MGKQSLRKGTGKKEKQEWEQPVEVPDECYNAIIKIYILQHDASW